MQNLEKRISALEMAKSSGFMVVILLPNETPAEARARLNIPPDRRGVAFVHNALANV